MAPLAIGGQEALWTGDLELRRIIHGLATTIHETSGLELMGFAGG
jgi:hypothetical protein